MGLQDKIGLQKMTARSGRVILALTLSALAITACTKGSFDQDPLANQAEAIKKAVKPGEDKAKTNEPEDSDALRILTDDFFSFKEGVDSGVKIISGRMLILIDGKPAENGKDFDLLIKNLQDFPGAQFDAATGNFTWVPPIGTVDSGMMRTNHLNIEMYSRAKPLVSRKTIPVFITRESSDPEIVAITGIRDRLHEGDLKEFTITVKDPDSVDTDAGRPRLLVVSGSAGKSNIAQWISQSSVASQNPVQDPSDRLKWVFKMRLDLRDAEITNDEGTFDFGVMAINRSGLVSSPMKQDVRIATSVRKPLITWKDMIEVTAGQPSTTNFTVYDPQSEGRITVTINNCPPGATCTCNQPSYGAGSAVCSIFWRPAAATRASDYAVSITAKNTSPNYYDSNMTTTVQFNPRFHVLAGGMPAPLSER